MYGGRRQVRTEFWLGNLCEGEKLEDLGVRGKIILKRIIKNRLRMWVDWTDLVPDTVEWSAFVKAIINFRVPQNAGNFLTSSETVGSLRRTLLPRVTYLLI
jgi:hypothetical protein